MSQENQEGREIQEGQEVQEGQEHQEGQEVQEGQEHQENKEIIRTSDFDPKIYDSDDPKSTSILHYNLWRVFINNILPETELSQQQQQSDQSSAQSSGQQPPTGDDDTRSSTHEDAQSTNITAQEPSATIRHQEEDIDSTHIPHPRARTDQTSLHREDPNDSLSNYCATASPDITRRSVKRNPEAREKLWKLSDFNKREKNYPGCTVTIADFSQTRFRFERRTIYTKEAHGDKQYTAIQDCDPKATPKRVFLEKLEKSKVGLKKSLKHKPSWSNLRWVNVNGIEKDSFFSIIDGFKLDSKATNYMFNAGDNFNVDTYSDGQLFCELCVLHCFEDNTNVDQSAALFEPTQKETMVEKLHRLFPNVTTYLSDKSKLRKFEPDKVHQSLFADDEDVEFERNAAKFEASKLLKTFNYSIGVERAWLFMTKKKEVISFFENTGEQVEEVVLFDFIRNLRFHGEMETDKSVCFENILSAFALNLEKLVTLYQSLLYRFKVDLNTNASTKRLQKLHLMTDELNALKVRVDRLAKMVEMLIGLASLSEGSKPYMMELRETLEGDARTIKEMIDSIKNLIDLTFNQVAANTNKYMALLALVSMVFLPMSFVTSFFGMNYFNQPLHHIGVFWVSSVALTMVTVCFVGFPSIKRALCDAYERASNIYYHLQYEITILNKIIKYRRDERRRLKNGKFSTTTTQSQETGIQSQTTGIQTQGAGSGIAQARSSNRHVIRPSISSNVSQAVRSAISSNHREQNSNIDVNFNNSRTPPNVSNTVQSSSFSKASSISMFSRPNDDILPSSSTIRHSTNSNVDTQNHDATSVSWVSDEIV
ncbi:unnamed protein product [Ambrosiozyma monospora]|uniref:Unnamed protein product n=1 Tax=Ambrosiozyma monospora TaxID=43982 RepID=A0ACB5SS74_AMBMO|nr:unnamed protein product [Ambrosiozyma monospora]